MPAPTPETPNSHGHLPRSARSPRDGAYVALWASFWFTEVAALPTLRSRVRSRRIEGERSRASVRYAYDAAFYGACVGVAWMSLLRSGQSALTFRAIRS